ncbi:MAG: immunoglobulin-like domain-containing protein [Clostridiaceae bacterium]|nr:immunoglobulin-like domain-containing protein [Clostridiaceae bacterium]
MKRNKLRRGLSFCMAFCMSISLLSGTAVAATISASAFNDTTTLNVPKIGSITPVKLDDDVTISSSSSFSDGYLLFENTGPAVPGDKLSIVSDSSPTAYGAISSDGSTVYLGNGSGKAAIGSIDSSLNGENGNDLKILFFTELANGGFEDGTENWAKTNSVIRLSGDSTVNTSWGNASTTIEATRKNPYFNWNWVDTVDGSSSYMRLYLSTWINDSYGTLHGPKITSTAFSASNGDSVSLYYYAKNTGDKYDVYGYLKDTVTGKQQQLFFQRGDQTDGWQAVSAKITLPDSDNFVFEFLCGSQDGTGGRYISSELLIDNVRVVSDLVSSQVATNVARRVAMVSASQSTRTSTTDRAYKLTAVDGAGGSATSNTTAVVKIHTYPAAPVITTTPESGTTDTVNLTWSATDATAYNVWVSGTQVYDGTTATSMTISGLSPNEGRTVTAVGTNDMGDSASTEKAACSNAAVPSLSAASSNNRAITLDIGNNGNSAGTAYCLERSSDGTNWAVVNNYAIQSGSGDSTTYADSGLSTNTGYYYRVKARNGNSVETVYSNTLFWKTATDAPTVTVAATSGASDSLDVSWTAPIDAVSYTVNIDSVAASKGIAGTAGVYNGFSPNTPHIVCIAAYNSFGDSPYSGDITRYTLAKTPEITFGEVTADSMVLIIANNGNAADTAYRLERSIDGDTWTPIENYTIYAGSSNSFSYMVSNLNAGTQYYYRVKAVNGDSVETAYSTASVKMTLPAAPTGLTMTPQAISKDESGNQNVSVLISWTAPTGADSYSIYRKAGGESGYTQIESAYMGGVLYMDSGLTPNTQYAYYIVANNTSGASEGSAEVHAYTLAAVPDIESEVSGDTINLTIVPNGNPEFGSTPNLSGTGYFIQYSTDSGTTWINLSDEWYYYLSPQHTGVSSGNIYQYRVMAKNGDEAQTDYSGSSSARTNEAPVISIASPAASLYRSAQDRHTAFTMSGTVSDADGDSVRIYAAIDGVKKSTVVNATASGVSWSLTWDIAGDGISQSDYSSIAVFGDDGYKGYCTAYLAYTLHVDQTAPELPSITPTAVGWTNDDSVSVAIANGADGGSEPDYTEYKLSGATSRGWTTYTSAFTVTNPGETVITARTVDNVGNVGDQQTATIKIDRAAPEGGSISVSAIYGDTAYTMNTVVNLTISASDSGGSGGDLDPSLPKYMQISNSSTFDSYTEVVYSTSYSGWTLSSGDGEKTVYARFVDSVGNIGEAISASIILDTTDPLIAISSPSSFNAKKGSTITYELTVNEESALSGINEDDTSYISLSTFGDFSSDDINAIIAGITVAETDDYRRTVSIYLPETISGSEGTIGITILSGAATDTAGNTSAQAVGNASFVIDAIAPSNQNTLFSSDITAQGGQSVTLECCSEDCDGGYDSDSVRFASNGLYGDSYDGSDPANGTTITSTHGRSMVINAPKEDGTYYLYVIDAAGNASNASTAVLTVKNYGPSVNITGPSDSYVNSGDSVSYTAVYSSDADSISLSADDVALVTRGTANAYVSISDVPGESLKKTITLYNLMGEGTVQVRIASATALDTEGNLAMASAASDPVTVDNTPASALELVITSDNTSDSDYAVKGNTLTLMVQANEALSGVSGTIAGRAVTFSQINSDTTLWSAYYTIPTDSSLDDLDGSTVPFTIVMTDLTGNVSHTLTEDNLEGIGGVTLDFTSPILSISGDTDSLGRYIAGATITFNEGTCIIKNTDSGDENEIVSGAIVYDAGTYTVVVTNSAGNTASKTFTVSYGSIMLNSDIGNLAITYAEGDSADKVTRDITLPLLSSSGSDISWTIDSGSAVSLSGIDTATEDEYSAAVIRPEYADGAATVVLTAEITVDGITNTKTFTLTVKAKTDDSQGFGDVSDDVENALITYFDGDSQNSVTLDVALGDTGLLHGSAITWTSGNEDVLLISDTAENGAYTGTVTRPAYGSPDVDVTITATATDPGNAAVYSTYTFTLTVKAVTLTDLEKAAEDYDYVYIVYAVADSASSVTQDLTFNEGVVNGSTVTWKSSNTAYVTDTGAVTRPSTGLGNADVTITATINNGSATLTRRFTVTVISKEPSSPSEALALDLAALEIGYYGDDGADSVTTHIVLSKTGDYGSTISWASSDEGIISADGTVSRPTDNDASVTVTATLTNGTESTTATFTLKVIATDDSDILQQILDDTEDLEMIYAGSDSASFVSDDLTLRTAGANGSTITWGSSDEDIIGTNGEVSRPSADTEITLTATVEKYSEEIEYWVQRTKTFTVTVSKSGSMCVESDLDDVKIVYSGIDSAGSVTSSVYLAKKGTTGCRITWTSSNTDYITSSGTVMRPDPDSSDHVVTLTATVTNTVTGEAATKVFTLTVIKMTEADVVREAAKDLTVYEAFEFESDSDIWESVTSGFLMLTDGSYGSTISWTSGNSDIISIGDVDSLTDMLTATVTRPTGKDTGVILTATITYGSSSATKTFLMIVKAADAVRTTTRQEESGAIFDLSTEIDSGSLIAFRTVVNQDGADIYEYIDTAIFDPDTIEPLTSEIDPSGTDGERTLTLTMPSTTMDDQTTTAQAIEIPASSVALMTGHNVMLVVDSAFGEVTIPADTLASLADAGTDIYFMIKPIEDEDEQEALSSAALKCGGSGSSVIGTPLMIQSNYKGQTYITIPFGNAEITKYSGLRVYVSHSDGTVELLSGTLVYAGNSTVPYGIRFSVSAFSDFQIIKIATHASSTSSDDDSTGVSFNGIEKALSSEDGYIFKGEDGLVAAFSSGDIDFNDIRNAFNGNSDDIEFTFTLGSQNPDDAAKTKNVITAAGLTMVEKPFTFGVSTSLDDTEMELQSFERYVDILIPLTNGHKITTAIRIDKDGSIIHIPTEVIVVGDNYYARIHALVTGTFALIWNPSEMDDVTSHWAKADVNDMASRLVVKGIGNNLFDPDRPITRAEFAVILVRGLGLLRGVGNQNFTDVSSDSWYTEYIETAVSYGFIYGYGDGCFGPEDTITREQAMAMMSRAMNLTELDGTVSGSELTEILSAFTDSSELSVYAKAPAAGCIKTGVIRGIDETTLSPQSYITRAQAATAIRRLLQSSGMID